MAARVQRRLNSCPCYVRAMLLLPVHILGFSVRFFLKRKGHAGKKSSICILLPFCSVNHLINEKVLIEGSFKISAPQMGMVVY